MTKLSDKGFAAIEAFLIVLVLVIVGGAGFFVYKAQNDTKNTLDQAIKTSQVEPNTSKPKQLVPAGWVKYDGGTYSFAYPEDWVKNVCEQDKSTVLLGPTTATAGKCNSDSLPQIAIYTGIGDTTANYKLASGDYLDLSTQTIVVNGESATKQSGTVNNESEFGIGPENGTKTIHYVFYHKGKTYAFIYNEQPSYNKDYSTEFEQLVTKTLKFE